MAPKFVESVKEKVEALRQNRSKGKARRSRRPSRPEDAVDYVEEGLSIPISVLEGCEKSFLAANENKEKASTAEFSDTGLVACVCRHDRVLWLVNMTTAGEKQYYAISLLEALFQELPTWWSMGVLYDIGCQLHRSVMKVSHQRSWSLWHVNGRRCPLSGASYHPTPLESSGGYRFSMLSRTSGHANARITLGSGLASASRMGRGANDAGVL